MTTFILPLPPSSNSLFANSKRGGRFRTQKYDSWIMEAGAEIMRQRPPKVAGPVTLKYEFKEPSGRKFDLGNREKAATDLLVSHGIIQADDNTIVRGIDLRWAPPEVEGVRVTIEPLFHRVPVASQGNAES